MRRLFLKFASFVPIVLLVAAVNRSIDPARFYGTHFLDPSRDRYEGTVIDNLLAGRSQTLVGPYNEPLVHEAVFRAKRPIDVLILGSSVAKAINSDSFPGQHVYNGSISAYELEEAAAVYQLAWEAGRRPKRVVLEFHGHELGPRGWDILPELAPVMLRVRKRLGLPTDAESKLMQFAENIRPDKQSTATQFTAEQGWLHPYDKLFSVRYFQFCLRSLGTARPEEKPPTAGIGEKAMQPAEERQVLCPDGSVLWSRQWLSHTPKQIRQRLQIEGFKAAVSNRATLFPGRCRLFDAWMTDLEQSGTQIELVLVPPFPAAADRMRTFYEQVQRHYPVADCESYLRSFAAKHRLQIDGSLDPHRAGVTEDEYVDYIHMRREGIGRLMARGKTERGSGK